jgi:tagaturonate reductase
VSGPPATGARAAPDLPEKVLQFGEGNFLRAFVDWMIQRMNDRGLFGGRVVVVQPIARGAAAALNRQQCRYTVLLRGVRGGEVRQTREVVESVSRALDPHIDFDAFLACARIPELRFVVSNTTEAGIRRDSLDQIGARPAPSFPGKLTQILHERFRWSDGDPARGLVVLPCELIERNGPCLRQAVLETAAAWDLPARFVRWLDEACVFTSTLVDRIVTGFPAAEAEALFTAWGYRDELAVAGEVFHAWVIESPAKAPQLAAELPLAEAGLDVTFAPDVAPYRERKVRILNGAHTMMVPPALLAGVDTVGAAMEDSLLRAYVERGIADEILPTLRLPRAELETFAASVIERFSNPFIEHRLLSIALNSVSKVRARILPTVKDHLRLCGGPPEGLAFALAALMVLYRGTDAPQPRYHIEDDPAALATFAATWAGAPRGADAAVMAGAMAPRLLARADLWGEDVTATAPAFAAAVTGHLGAILSHGVRPALARLLGG